MSIEAYRAVWEDSRTRGSTLLVLLSMAWHADEDGLVELDESDYSFPNPSSLGDELPISHAVFEHSDTKGSARLVLLALAWFADTSPGGLASPSVATIARYTRLDVFSVRRVLRVLFERGDIYPVGKTDSGDVIYRLTIKGGRSA